MFAARPSTEVGLDSGSTSGASSVLARLRWPFFSSERDLFFLALRVASARAHGPCCLSLSNPGAGAGPQLSEVWGELPQQDNFLFTRYFCLMGTVVHRSRFYALFFS
jgi:hypothetical protein